MEKENTLKSLVLNAITSYENKNNIKYQIVIATFSKKNTVILDEIYSYILRYLVNYSAPTDSNILSIITPEFCIDRAYEYIIYLQNSHEISHEVYNYLR